MMYCENVSAKPDSGRDSTQTRVLSQNGRALVTMSCITPLGNDGIGLGEDGAAGQQLALAGVAALRRVIGRSAIFIVSIGSEPIAEAGQACP